MTQTARYNVGSRPRVMALLTLRLLTADRSESRILVAATDEQAPSHEKCCRARGAALRQQTERAAKVSFF